MLKENTNREKIFNGILRAIASVLDSRGEEEKSTVNISFDTDLISDLGIDSVEVLDLIGFIEKEFNISVDLEKVPLKPKINDIVQLVQHTVSGE